MRVAVRVLGVAAIALLLAVGASAQLSKGFRGRVLDKEGKPVIGVTVNLQDQSNAGNHYDVKTDEQGYYTQIGIPYSDKGYIIKTQIPGMSEMGMLMKAKLMDTLELIFDPRKCVGVLGTVKDKQGQLVPNATVTIVNLADETQPYTVKTDSKGAFKKGELPYSDKGYRITAQIPGEQPFTKNFAMATQMIGQPEREPTGERPIFQIAYLDLSFDFANPTQGGGTGAAAASKASDAQQMFEMGDYEGAVSKAGEAISANDNVKVAMLIRATCPGAPRAHRGGPRGLRSLQQGLSRRRERAGRALQALRTSRATRPSPMPTRRSSWPRAGRSPARTTTTASRRSTRETPPRRPSSSSRPSRRTPPTPMPTGSWPAATPRPGSSREPSTS